MTDHELIHTRRCRSVTLCHVYRHLPTHEMLPSCPRMISSSQFILISPSGSYAFPFSLAYISNTRKPCFLYFNALHKLLVHRLSQEVSEVSTTSQVCCIARIGLPGQSWLKDAKHLTQLLTSPNSQPAS